MAGERGVTYGCSRRKYMLERSVMRRGTVTVVVVQITSGSEL